jgi:Na+/H+ antiporter NhaC
VESSADWGLLSLIPLAVTLLLAFLTRSAVIAMLTGTFVGTLMLGGVPGASLNQLFQASLGNEDFIWIVLIVVLIGVLFEGFKRAGVMAALAARAAVDPGQDRTRGKARRKAELTTWGLGFLIVDDYFSPLMTGAVMRPLTDKVGVPREKLAFLLDATTASVCILVPFTAWGAYLASLIAAQGGPVSSVEDGLSVFIHAIPYNFYPLLIIGFALLVALRVIPDFGPMRRAERRVQETGALIRPGANPLVDDSVDASLEAAAVADAPGQDATQAATEEKTPSLLLELALPVAAVVSVFAWSLIALGSVKIVEAFMAGAVVLISVLLIRGRLRSASDVAALITRGAESVMPALIIVALAYALNEVARQLGVGDAIIGLFNTGLSIDWLVPLTFVVTAAIAFSTGTSWGSFALMMPVALPVAISFSGGELSVLVYQTVAAIAGGGIFGDHASPVSDTTVLASLGAGSDHMDHVITQLPYALAMAGVTLLIYVLV